MATATLNPATVPLDTTVRLVTPERITFQYPLAGPFHRACSYLIDLAVIFALAIAGLIAAMLLSLGTGAGFGMFLVFFFGLYQFYGAFCEAVFNGQTLGKKLLGLRVVSADGVPITGGQAVLRNLLWAFDGVWPFGYLPAVACMLLTRKFQRLGDLAAGTMVVVERRTFRGSVSRMREPAIERMLTYMPTTIPAGPELSKALADYVKRRGRFTRARREEIAAHLAGPLRRRYNLPDRAPGDVILCAAYHRVFLGE